MDHGAKTQGHRRDLGISGQIASRSGFNQKGQGLFNVAAARLDHLYNGLIEPSENVRGRLLNGQWVGEGADTGGDSDESK